LNTITRRLAAVAFADIAGWTHWVEADELAALSAWNRLRTERIEPMIREHGGRLVDTAGDAVFVEFASAVDAVTWAVDLQRVAKAKCDTELRLRIGLNIGDLLVDGERLAGDAVNVAARLHQLAAPGEIVATDAVRQQVQQRIPVRFHDLGERTLKNIHRPIRAFRVEAEGIAAPPRASIASDLRGTRALLALDLPQSARSAGEQRVKDLIAQVAQHGGGRLLRHDARGALLDFPGARPAVAAAFALRRACGDVGMSGIGVQMAEALPDADDLYGGGADIAARLSGLAGPGGVVVSAAVHNDLTPLLDADIEDLGECYLNGMNQPVRAYRIEPPGTSQEHDATTTDGELRPSVAVIPFAERGDGHSPIGEILAEAVIAALSRSAELNVVSRLSSTAFRGRSESLGKISEHLKAQYVLSGAYRCAAGGVVLRAELADAQDGRVVWAGELKGRVAGVIEGHDELIDHLVLQTSQGVAARELARTRTHSLQSLQTCTLLIAAITLLHRLSPADFNRAREMLEAVVRRVPRHPVPLAWLAQWHVLRVWQGWSEDVSADTHAALECGRRALDNDSHCSLALAIDGFAHTNLRKDLDVGQQRYDLALQLNPSESLAWLLRGVLHAFKGEGQPALRCAQRALRLSPLDPQRYFYDALAASAEISAGRYDRAIVLAKRSLRANRLHASTFRVLAVGQWLSGQHDEARASVVELMRVQPQLTVGGWLSSAPSAKYPIGNKFAEALRGAGVPA
jgi:class 3 adenylate cyclase/tetratricopeptide (TPR) repeat protein